MYWFHVGVNEKGRGVYAKTGLPSGEAVLVYGGCLLPETSDRLHNEYEHLPEYPGSYIYDFRYNGRSYCFDATADDGRWERHSSVIAAQKNIYMQERSKETSKAQTCD